MYPSQDAASGIGNLIALPLQGRALKSGSSAFVDENWNTYPNQWDILLNHTPKISVEDIERCMAKWQAELADGQQSAAAGGVQNRPKPWKKKEGFTKSDVVVRDEVIEHFAVIDDVLVWHGGMNLLGKEDAWDNLMRIQSPQVAAELLAIAFGIPQTP